ncbi:MAG: pyridoxal phosphate-dependent aminotransferase [Oscillospiraceae bacterium]|nr:pyridoxal phosphate-dependent aminotransferase [Oscillospiraceae bacterium]
MQSAFDEIINREHTGSVKHTLRSGESGVIPMWVADMDFRVPEQVTEALAAVARHGIFGYTDPDESYDHMVCGWYRRNFGWEAKPEWNIRTPGVVFSIACTIRALTSEGDSVLIQQPVYYPFMEIIRDNGRRIVVNELRFDGGKYEIDFADFEGKIKANRVKLFILCSPHNPVGRVWTKDELSRMGEICLKHGVYVISDEIHSDFVFSGHRHTVFADVSPALANITITCTSPMKTFNLAGLQTANIFIVDAKLWSVFLKEYRKTGYAFLNTAGLAATKAAYLHGQSWRDELIAYLEENVACLRMSLAETNGVVKLTPPEGTYLMWLDCRRLMMSDTELNRFFIKKAKLKLHKGVTFGKSGSGFMRMNIACPKSTIERAVGNLKNAIKEAGV